MQGVTIWLTGPDAARIGQLIEEARARLKVALAALGGRPLDVLYEVDVLERLCGGQRPEEGLAEMRLGYVCRLLARNGVAVLAVSRSPVRARRDALRKEIGNFVEVLVEGPDVPDYEKPHYPEVRVAPGDSPAEAAIKIESALGDGGFLGVAQNVYSLDEEASIKERLQKLGYIE